MNKIKTLLIIGLIWCCTYTAFSNNNKNTIKDRYSTMADSAFKSSLNWRLFFYSPHLNKLIDTLLTKNADIQIAYRQLDIANTYYKMSKGALWPSVQTSLTLTPTSGWYKVNPPIGYGVNVASSWEIDLWGKLSNQKKAARVRFLASEQGIRMVKTALIAELAKAYYELVFYDEELRVTDKNINLQSNAFEIVKVQKAAGKATNLAVLQFEAQLLDSKTKKFEIERQIIHYENFINLLLNRGYQTIVRDKKFDLESKSKLSLKEIPSSEITNRPDIAEANLQMQAAGFDVKAAQKAFYPSLVIQPNIGILADLPTKLLNPIALSWGVFSSLTTPIFQNYLLKGRLKIKEAERKQAIINYQHKLYKGFAEVSENISKIESTENEISILKNQVAVLDSAVSNSHDLYVYGYASYLEVINTQKSVQDAELKLISIEKEQCHLWIDLFRALGGGE
jgi:multidrug efflux system outer membrane protein